MERNYWKEYWDSYYKFVALYLREVQKAYPNADLKKEYTEVARLFEPSMPLENNDDNDEYIYLEEYDYAWPEEGQSDNILEDNQPGNTQETEQSGNTQAVLQPTNPFGFPAGNQPATPFISPGGGQFTINNCRRMAIVRIVMRRGFNPSEFFFVVDRADRRSIQGFRITCEGGRVRFVPMAVEYRNINLIECAF